MMERRNNQRKIAFYHPEGNQLAKSFFFNYDRQFYFHNDCHLVYSKQIF